LMRAISLESRYIICRQQLTQLSHRWLQESNGCRLSVVGCRLSDHS
jgi:hypothetical protein